MSTGVPYGSTPWPQTFWDARAAANFVCGGLGAGLVVAAVLSGAQASAFAVPMLVGLAIVACGLAAVFAELGRPLRAAGVVRNAATSWMTREALVAPLLMACGVGAVAGSATWAIVAALLALAFVYCQGRMVQAARGIPAWRAPQVPWLFVATSLAEGLGSWLVLAAFLGTRSTLVAGLLGVAVVARYVLFRAYRLGLGARLAPAAASALDRAGRVLLHAGTWPVLALLVLAAAASPYAGARWLALLAGLAAAFAGAWLKAAMMRRAAYVQGYALPVLPVRGGR